MKNILACTCGARYADVGPFLLRVVTGLIFLVHGYQKYSMMGIDGTAGFLSSLGFPLATMFAVLLLVAEIGGGILLIIGAYTHWAAKILAFVALVALLTVHVSKGFMVSNGGYEFILLILVASISLMLSGAGRWSVDRAMKK